MNDASSPSHSKPSPRQAESIARQDWPASTLYVVATPIGNLADLSPRACHALRLADVIAAEDTRTSRPLLDHWDIATPLMAAHQHNEAQAAHTIIEKLAAGQRVALISDAGTPAVSDPGARIVSAVRTAGYRVIPLPGPSAVLAALMVSGMTSDANPAYVFAGFTPHKTQARQTWLKQWCKLPAPIVMFESPHRLAATLRDLESVCGPNRQLTLARELTKRFEEITTLSTGEAEAWLAARPQGAQGEFVLIVEAAPDEVEQPDRHDTLLTNLLQHMGVRDAARIAAEATGASRHALYDRALILRDSTNDDDDEAQ